MADIDPTVPKVEEARYQSKTTKSYLQFIEDWFRIKERGSTWGTEIRAGCVLFMTSAYILFLNPLILSGNAGGVPTGMPANDVSLATSIATGSATFLMGAVANYPWVVSTQLGTNNYFVNNLIQPSVPCGKHAHLIGNGKCAKTPCSCSAGANGTTIVDVIGTAEAPGVCFGTGTYDCIGSKVPYEKALACAFLEGVAFLIICFTGLRSALLKCIPRTILMAGSCGIGLFISFVGSKDMGLIVGAPYPTLLQLNTELPYTFGGWGKPGYKSGVGFNSCELYFMGPPYGPVCPWLSTGGLIFTGILLVWNINGAFIIGIFFTMFISWMKFPNYQDENPPGLVPRKVASAPKFIETAGALDFDWSDDMGDLVGALFLFLYLDFIGSCITFVAMGEMHSILNDHGDMPRSNFAFIADGFGSLLGGILGSSALTTYVESAAAVREGGRTGITAIVCSLFFFASVFLAPLFSNIPSIATGPILVLIGILIFMQSVYDVNWKDLTEAIPAVVTMLGMPLTHNIAYGVIGGMIAYVFIKFFTFQLFGFQKNWYGRELYLKWTHERSLFMRVPGWNCDFGYKREQRPVVRFAEFLDNYKGLEGVLEKMFPSLGKVDEAYTHGKMAEVMVDDAIHVRSKTSSNTLPVVTKDVLVAPAMK